MIWPFTWSILFLAVPHKGSDRANWVETIAGIYQAATTQPSNSLLESVKKSSDYNEHLNARFEPLHVVYTFYSWVEGLPLRKPGCSLGIGEGK